MKLNFNNFSFIFIFYIKKYLFKNLCSTYVIFIYENSESHIHFIPEQKIT